MREPRPRILVVDHAIDHSGGRTSPQQRIAAGTVVPLLWREERWTNVGVVFARSGADVVACDFSLGMLQAGQARLLKKDPFQDKTRGRISFAAGDALHLPFKDGAFDAVTISFGLRNVHGTRAALEEMRRVTRPGGRLVVCEFGQITIAPLDMLYRRYLTGALPAIARRAARNPVAYEYLAESINDWPAQRELADVIRAAGWSSVRWRDLTLGVVAVHVARNL